ncbi:MAG TPA: hypothetical protein VGS19_07765 [Streptosporangiaceae bacterium]|nr:hypothetical protein [Streptosporangiaceae bacterium]
MSSTSASGGRSSGKMIAVIVLGVIALVSIVAAIIFFVEPAHSLPAFMGQIKFNGHNHARAYGTRPLHGAAALVLAVVCLVGAWFVNRGGKAANSSSASNTVDAGSRN